MITYWWDENPTLVSNQAYKMVTETNRKIYINVKMLLKIKAAAYNKIQKTFDFFYTNGF